MRQCINIVKLFINFQKKNLNSAAIREELISLNSPNVVIRRYAPLKITKKSELSPIFLPHGLNHFGHDDPRMIHLARALCACGYTVYTPHLASIVRYDIDFKSAGEELQASLNYIAQEKPLAQISIICFSLIASLTLYITSLSAIGPRVKNIFMLSGYYDVDAFIDYVLFDRQASQFAKFILLKNLFYYQYILSTELEEQFLRTITILQAQSGSTYQGDLTEFPVDLRAIIDNVIHTKNSNKIQRTLGQSIEKLKNACRLDIAFNQAKPNISIVHSRDDTIIPSSEAYKLEAAFREQTTVRTLVTPIFDHADIKLNINTIREFIKLCSMLNFL